MYIMCYIWYNIQLINASKEMTGDVDLIYSITAYKYFI